MILRLLLKKIKNGKAHELSEVRYSVSGSSTEGQQHQKTEGSSRLVMN